MKRALLFPGQGAQAPGMGADLAAHYPACRALFERASVALGYDLEALCREGPAETLTRSDRAQPAIFVVSMAVRAALEAERPDLEWVAAAGLSSGEWAALAAAGAVDFETAVRILAERGRLMQEACEARPGGMVSVIGLDRSALERICAQTGAWIANLNSPEQTVLSAPAEALEAVEQAAAAAGARRALRLRVAGGFHSPLMASAADGFGAALAQVAFAAPRFPVYSNVTAAPHEEPASMPARMVEQIVAPVRWVETVRALRASGVDAFVECGPGRVLTGLVKRIDSGAFLHTIQDRPGVAAAAAVL